MLQVLSVKGKTANQPYLLVQEGAALKGSLLQAHQLVVCLSDLCRCPLNSESCSALVTLVWHSFYVINMWLVTWNPLRQGFIFANDWIVVAHCTAHFTATVCLQEFGYKFTESVQNMQAASPSLRNMTLTTLNSPAGQRSSPVPSIAGLPFHAQGRFFIAFYCRETNSLETHTERGLSKALQ